MLRYLILGSAVLSSTVAFAQTEGNNVFGTDQILQVDVTFYSDGFWNELLTEYDGEQNYIPAGISITSLDGVAQFDSVGIRLKGNSSMNHPGDKKPFKVDFNRYISGQAYDLLKKLNFNNGFKDPTFVREKIFYDVCEEAGILAPRANFAQVTFNGEPWGFYTVVEQIDDQFLDRSIGDDDGMLFKAGSNFGQGSDEASLVYQGPTQADYGDAYELKMNDPGNWSDFIAFLEFLNTSSDADFESLLGTHLDLQPSLRSVALDNLFANLDSYTLSARNYYLYQNTTLGRWQWIKWDCNETFGSYAMGVPGPMTELDVAFDGGNYERPLLQRILASDALSASYLAEICDLREDFFNSAYLDPRLDALKALIETAVYADNNKMYSNADFEANFDSDLGGGGPGGGGPGGSLYGLKPFVAERGNFVDGAIDCATVSVPRVETVDWALFPNPAHDQLHITFNDNSAVRALQIFNTTGQLVWEGMRSTGEVEVNVSTWPSGMYVVTSTSNERRGSQRFVKE